MKGYAFIHVSVYACVYGKVKATSEGDINKYKSMSKEGGRNMDEKQETTKISIIWFGDLLQHFQS